MRQSLEPTIWEVDDIGVDLVSPATVCVWIGLTPLEAGRC